MHRVVQILWSSGDESGRRIASYRPGILALALCSLLFGLTSSAGAAVYYVNAQDGSDAGPGTLQAPWKTMSQVQARSAQGDTVHLLAWNDTLANAAWPPDRAYQSTEVYQYGVRWTFDEERQIGQFLNGDYWVLGPVVVKSVSPAPTQINGASINGSVVNPSRETQGYDSRADSYENQGAQYPLHLNGDASLVSTVSWTSDQSPDVCEVKQTLQFAALRSAAVLTVLGQAPPSDAFRPPYFGAAKPIYRESDLDYSKLPSLLPTQYQKNPAYDFADIGGRPARGSKSVYPTVADRFKRVIDRPWIMHVTDWQQRTSHPTDNQPNYYRETYDVMQRVAVLLCYDLDKIYQPGTRRKLVIPTVQLGIDSYYIFNSVPGERAKQLWPVLFAGVLFQDSQFQNIVATMKARPYTYGTFYYRNEASSTIASSRVAADKFYHGYKVGFRLYPGSSGEYEHLWPGDYNFSEGRHPGADHGEWALPPYDKGLACCAGAKLEAYRGIKSSGIPGLYVALKTFQMEPLWNHPAFFDYVERYMTDEHGNVPSTFIREAYEACRTSAATLRAVNDSYAVPKNSQSNLLRVLTNDVSPEGTLAIKSVTQPANGNVVIVENGTCLSFTPNPEFVGSDSFSYTIDNGQGQTAGATVAVKVEQPNAAPVLGNIDNQNVNENTPVAFSVSATDADGDPITYSATGVPSGASFTGQTFAWTPGFSQAGTYSVTFTAGDGRAQDSKTITISVADVNRAPALAAIGDRSVDEDNTLTLALSAADPDGAGLTYSATELPAGANLSGQNFTWTPGSDQTGSHEITFVVSDGELTDSETINVMVVSAAADQTGPVVARHAPAPGAIQVPLNNLITLHVTDAGKGVNPASVTIAVDGEVVYQGDSPVYTGTSGKCARSGVKNDYEFIYQNNQTFDFDHEVVVTVNAADLAGNVMNEATYSFGTEMRAFGSNTQVSKTGAASKGGPVTVGDAAGNIWAAWHAGAADARDIYVARLPAGRNAFENPIQITRDAHDQCNPDLALAANGALYVVWQDNRLGQWDIYASVSNNGQTFSKEAVVTDANDNQTAPTVAVDSGSPNRIYVAWQDDRNGNQDIYVGSSTNAFASVTESRVTTDAADQTEPDLAVGAANAVYLAWTDKRNNQADIYGAASTASWANVALATGPGDQTSPAVAADGSMLYLLWADDVSGDSDVCYASSDGMPTGPLTGVNIVDDTSGAAQTAPAVTCAGGKVFACWQDARNVGVYGDDMDVYFAELSSGGTRTNVLVSDGGAGAGQSEPAIALGTDGQPYIVWTDDRGTATEIYCAATTYVDPTPLDSAVVAASGATIGTAPTAVNSPDDVSIVIPAGACQANLRVSISKILNPLIPPDDCLGSYDFGPSGIEFDQPVTVTIPYEIAGGKGQAKAYWYNSLTGALSQQGITDIENVTLSGNLHALRFKTTHFTPYYLVAGDSEIAASGSGGGGSGGCSMSVTGDGSPEQLLVPYAIVAVAMAILRYRDKKRAARNTES